MEQRKILAASPIRQKPSILDAFLRSMGNIVHETFVLDYLFIDDNDDPVSSELLKRFQREVSRVTIVKGLTGGNERYIVDDKTHYWTYSLVDKVAAHKNAVIRTALEEAYDYVFFIDSDVVVHPELVEQLLSDEKDIVSEIFWTKWQRESPELPNVWMFDKYDFADPRYGDNLDKARRAEAFLGMLKTPGVYEVGGLGACTLISRRVLEAGVNFSSIKNLTMWGEDRAFCVRAVVMGFELYVDTFYPAYHIYREKMLDEMTAFYQESN